MLMLCPTCYNHSLHMWLVVSTRMTKCIVCVLCNFVFFKKISPIFISMSLPVFCVFLCICLLLLCSRCWFCRLCVFCVFVFFSSFLSKVFFFKICPLKGLLLAPLGALYLICTQRSVRICPILAPRCYIRL